MRAVVFDLFGTLTDPAAEVRRRTLMGRTADALGVPADSFWREVSASFAGRITGAHGDTAETLVQLSRRCGLTPTQEQLDAAFETHHQVCAELREPRKGALAVLDELRSRGFALALLSDCSSELCETWDTTPYASRFDAAVLSYQEGYRKPDPRLYATAASRLGAPADACWYVGDGGSREHAGASAAGMTPVLVSNAVTPEAAQHRDDPDDFTPDLVVDDLDAVLDILGSPRHTAGPR